MILVNQIKKYDDSIAERTKLRRQESEIIKEKEKIINNELFKEYFNYKSPSILYNTLSGIKNTEEHNTLVNIIKSGLIDLKEDIRIEFKDDVNKIDKKDQERQGLKILTPNQMLSRLPISLA